jgi:hypothetical protein
MYPSVKSQFRKFNEPFEGVVSFMYLDVKGLVTIGVGNLIDPVGVALALPFRYKGTTQLASKTDIAAEWNLIKGKPELAQKRFGACAPLTRLELDTAAIDALIASRLQLNENFLKGQKPFLKFEQWPADAQLGLLSMAWAMGPGFGMMFPNFCHACEALDFKAAADQCKINATGNAGVIPRNRANKLLFMNAWAVLDGEDDGFYQRETLYYPTNLNPSTFQG